MSAQPKKKRGILAGIFLVDPWRKLLALGLGFISWYYVSTKITNTKVLLFRVTPIQAGKADYNANALNIPVPEGFVLWSVNGVPMEKNPKVRILFQGPHNRMQKITEYLRLAVLSERLTKVSKGNLRIEIKAEDLVVPQDPGLNDLIKEIVGPDGRTPAPLVLDFEEYLRKVPFVLGKGETRVVGTACPEGYEIDPDKGIWFTPSQVELSGPGKVINAEILNRPLPHRERLLEDFLLHSDARVRRSPTEGWEIVARLGLSTAWILKGVTLFPAQVEAHLPLRRVPSLINIPRLRIPVEFSGPGGCPLRSSSSRPPARHRLRLQQELLVARHQRRHPSFQEQQGRQGGPGEVGPQQRAPHGQRLLPGPQEARGTERLHPLGAPALRKRRALQPGGHQGGGPGKRPDPRDLEPSRQEKREGTRR